MEVCVGMGGSYLTFHLAEAPSPKFILLETILLLAPEKDVQSSRFHSCPGKEASVAP